MMKTSNECMYHPSLLPWFDIAEVAPFLLALWVLHWCFNHQPSVPPENQAEVAAYLLALVFQPTIPD